MSETMNMGLDLEGVSEERYKFDEGYIQLPLRIENLPATLSVSGYELLLKDEFHCSLVCVKDLQEKYGDDIEDKVTNLFNDFVSKNKITLTKYRDEFRLVKRGERVSVIVMCDISNTPAFFKLMNEELGIESDMQPTHVTIYTLQPNKGIGVNTYSGLQATQKIEVPTEVRAGLNLV